MSRLLHDERWQQRVEAHLATGVGGGGGGGGGGEDVGAKLAEFHQKLQMQILEFQSALAHQVAQSMTLFAKAVRDHYKDRSEKGGSELSSLQVRVMTNLPYLAAQHVATECVCSCPNQGSERSPSGVVSFLCVRKRLGDECRWLPPGLVAIAGVRSLTPPVS